VASHIIIATLSHTAANATIFPPRAGVQSGFTHLDASAVDGFGVDVTGSIAANLIFGTALADSISARRAPTPFRSMSTAAPTRSTAARATKAIC